MNLENKSFCDKIIEEMLLCEKELSPTAQAHIKYCNSCRAEHEKIVQMHKLISDSAPSPISMKDSVLDRINKENITIAPAETKRRRHIPFGTISAAVAVLAVGIFVYNSDIINKSNDAATENEAPNISESMIDEAHLSGTAFLSPAPENAEESILYDEVADEEVQEYADESCAAKESPSDTETDGAAANDDITEIAPETEESADMPTGAGSSDNAKAEEALRTETATPPLSNGNMVLQGLAAFNANSNPKDVYNYMYRSYPDRFTYESIEADGKLFVEFVLSLTDPENQYTAENFDEYKAERAE